MLALTPGYLGVGVGGGCACSVFMYFTALEHVWHKYYQLKC
jgi:hypothetical protein